MLGQKEAIEVLTSWISPALGTNKSYVKLMLEGFLLLGQLVSV